MRERLLKTKRQPHFHGEHDDADGCSCVGSKSRLEGYVGILNQQRMNPSWSYSRLEP